MAICDRRKLKTALFIGAFCASQPLLAWTLVTDPISSNDADAPSDCRFYFDSAAPVKIVVQQCTDTEKCPSSDGTAKGAGFSRCFADLAAFTLSNGSHSVQATHYINHPVSPAESGKSNAITFTWPIPAIPNVPPIPGALRLAP